MRIQLGLALDGSLHQNETQTAAPLSVFCIPELRRSSERPKRRSDSQRRTGRGD